MAVGDTVNALASIALNVATQIRPAAGAEWVVHNVYHASAVGVRWTDGSSILTFASQVGAGKLPGPGQILTVHVTNTRYLEVVNTTATGLIGWDAVVTK